MTDIAITPANVVKGASAQTVTRQANATITAGQVMYLDTDNRVGLCDADDASSVIRAPYGIALNGGAVNQTITVQRAGRVTIGGTVVIGEIYVASDTPGGVMPAADLEAGDYVAVLGVGVSATLIELNIYNSGAVRAA